MNFTIPQIEYALAVARCGQFSRAAEQCNVSQPSLSMQIAKLERIVGARIFDRDAQRVALTAFGDRFVRAAKPVMAELGRLQETVEREAQSRGRRAHIGVIPTIAPSVIHLLAEGFAERFPAGFLYIQEQTTGEVLRELRAGRLDAAIVAVPLREADIEETPLYEEPFVVCLPESHPLAARNVLTLDSIADEEILLLRDGHCMRNQALEVCRIAGSGSERTTFTNRVSFESGSFETLMRLVGRGLGITLVPGLRGVDDDGGSPLAGLAFREFVSPAPSRSVGLIALRDHRHAVPLSPIAEIISEGVKPALLRLNSAGQELTVLDPYPDSLELADSRPESSVEDG